MTTSGSSNFNLDLNGIVEEAFERCGQELRSGYDLRTARRSLNLLSIEWANRGINLWLMENGEIPLVRGVGSYDLPVDTIDLLEHVIRTGANTNQSDLNITRISNSTYFSIPNKLSEGRPIQVRVTRASGAEYPDGVHAPYITVWPVPDQSDFYIFRYWRLRRMQNMSGGITDPDIPFRFLPAMIAGLAYHLSMKIPGASERTMQLKAMYDETFQEAADEDREKATLRIPPRQYHI